MDIGFLITIICFDGLNYAAFLFLISVGLTFVFGVMRILNISHGAIYALGAYMATWLTLLLLNKGLPPYLSYFVLLAAGIIVGLITGPIIERLFLRRIYGSDVHIQLLLTFSILLIMEDAMKMIWGVEPVFVTEPYALLGQFSMGTMIYPTYNLLIIGISASFGVFLVWLIRGTRFGKLMVSVIQDREVSVAMGINVGFIYTAAFTLGALTAAIGGAFIAPTISMVPGFAADVVTMAFAVIAIGGMGNLEGAALGSLIVGLSRALALHVAPELELAIIYLIMVLVLAFRPKGLFAMAEERRI